MAFAIAFFILSLVLTSTTLLMTVVQRKVDRRRDHGLRALLATTCRIDRVIQALVDTYGDDTAVVKTAIKNAAHETGDEEKLC